MPRIYENPHEWPEQIMQIMHEWSQSKTFFPEDPTGFKRVSAVLMLLGNFCGSKGVSEGPCLISNKRSKKVKQPGDLCFPGGRSNPYFDPLLSELLKWPFSPLTRWPHWTYWRRRRPHEAYALPMFLATSLRESCEEMGLNPFGIRFLGPLPPESLTLFQRRIYPMIGWINSQRRFFPNWEVDRILSIPISHLVNPKNYACLRIHFKTRQARVEDFLSLIYKDREEPEVLWGLTFRLTIVFLKIIFDFTPPEMESLPILYRTLGEEYFTGYE